MRLPWSTPEVCRECCEPVVRRHLLRHLREHVREGVLVELEWDAPHHYHWVTARRFVPPDVAARLLVSDVIRYRLAGVSSK